jgi:hypothetical protein
MIGDTYITLLISISDGGVPYSIADGCLAKLSIKRPSGSHLEEFCKISNNAIIEYPFKQNENTCAEAGIHFCDVTLYSPEGEELGSPRFIMVVSEKVVRRDDIELSTDDYTAVDAMLKAEAGRQLEETKRVTAEEERVDAENARVTAEEERNTATEEVIERAERAAESAEEVARVTTTFIPDVSEDGVISWTNDKGLKNPSPVNVKGPRGEKGEDGTDGKSAYDYARDGGYSGTEEEFAEEIVNVSIKVKGHDSQLEALDKRITNAWGADGVWFRTEGRYTTKKSTMSVGTGVLPMAEIAIIGGTATEVISRTVNLVHVFERTSYHPNFDDHEFGWRADGKLFVQGYNYSGADKIFSRKLSAGTYKYTCETISEPEEGYYSIDLYTGENTNAGNSSSLESKIALDSSNKFTLTEETTVYIGVHTTKSISGSEGVFSLFLSKTSAEYAIIDSYKIPEEITSLEVWGNPTTFLDLKEGILYYGRESISSTEKGEAMDVRDIIGYDDYIIKVIPEAYSGLRLESASSTAFAVTFTLSDGGGTI